MGIIAGKYVGTARLDGKTAIITGCNTGIGKVTAKEFYRVGARVIMACRDVKKAEEAANEIRESTQGTDGKKVGEVIIHQLDLSSLTSVQECAEKILATEQQINILVNNAGIMMCPLGTTRDGFEKQFGTNHLGHFLFTCLLLPRIVKSTPARIVTVSSIGHQGGKINFDDLNWEKTPYKPMGAYSQSKLANILFSAELARKLQEKGISGVTTYSLHPGAVHTELARNMDDAYFKGARCLATTVLYPFIKTPEQGAQTTLHCALDEAAGNETGLYYSDCKVKNPSATARDEDIAKRLWDESLKLVGIENRDIFKEVE